MTPLPPPDPKFLSCPLCGQQTCDHKPETVTNAAGEVMLQWTDDLYVPMLSADRIATGAWEKWTDAKLRIATAEEAENGEGDQEACEQAVLSYLKTVPKIHYSPYHYSTTPAEFTEILEFFGFPVRRTYSEKEAKWLLKQVRGLDSMLRAHISTRFAGDAEVVGEPAEDLEDSVDSESDPTEK